MNPNYIDSYSALFDVYYWSERPKEALELIAKVQENSSSANEIKDKIAANIFAINQMQLKWLGG